jgi:hypothetical protein
VAIGSLSRSKITRAASSSFSEWRFEMADEKKDDSFTTAVALSYAITAVEKLPVDWQETDQLSAMYDLFGRIVPTAEFRAQFLDVARERIAGRRNVPLRPTIVSSDQPGCKS